LYHTFQLIFMPLYADVKADARPTACRPLPANKLTQKERAHILDICHQPQYASLPPAQIVPRLADKEQYVASKSSCSRMLHQADEQHHRGRSQMPRRIEPPEGFLRHWSQSGVELRYHVAGSTDPRHVFLPLYDRRHI
jgi:hypothetical protein